MKYLPLVALLLVSSVQADWTDYRVDSIVAHVCTEGTSVGPAPAQCGWYDSVDGIPSWGTAAVLTDDSGWIIYMSITAGMWTYDGLWKSDVDLEIDGWIDGQKILTAGGNTVHFSQIRPGKLKFLLEGKDGSLVRYILKSP